MSSKRFSILPNKQTLSVLLGSGVTRRIRQSYTYHAGTTGKKKLIDFCQLMSKAGHIIFFFWRSGGGGGVGGLGGGLQLFKRMNIKIPTLLPTVKNCLDRHL